MERLTSEYFTDHTPIKEVNGNEVGKSLHFSREIKNVRSTEININHFPALVVGKIFEYLSNEDILSLTLFPSVYLSEAKRAILGRKNLREMKLTFIVQQEKASQCIKNLSAISEHAGAKIDITTGNTMLHDAIMYRKSYLVKDLLKLKGLDINFSNKENFTAFALAAHDGQSDVIATLLKAPNIIINIGNGKFSQTALQFAIINGHRGIAEKIIKSGQCDINKQGSEGTTALHIAAKKGDIEIVRLLLEREDINVNCVHEDGDTALMVALAEKKYDVAKALMARKNINIRTKNKLGFSLLHIAMLHKRGDKSIVNALLVKGLDVNDKTNDGVTSLDIAITQGFKTGVEALLLHPQTKAGLSQDRIEHLQLKALMANQHDIAKIFERLSGTKMMSAQEFLHTYKR